MFFNQYPYINLNDLNLDYVLKAIKELKIQLDNFVSLNTIKYADPIQWNITRQYAANTVVLDALTGTAYLSKGPVPSGVALTDTDYWQVIFTLDLLDINNNITLRDDGFNVIATFASNTGDWLLWNNILYKVSQPIPVNTAYVVGFNLDRYTVELFIADYINALNTIIGDLNDLTTTDKDSIVNAINELVSSVGDLTTLTTVDQDSIVDAVNELVATIGDLNDLTTTDKDSIVDAINEIVTNVSQLESLIVTPEMFGAVGDGVTDDTAAINNCFAVGGHIQFKAGAVYLVDPDISVTPVSNSFINMNGATLKAKPVSSENYAIVHINQVENVILANGIIIGERDNHLGTTGEWGMCVDVYDSDHISIVNCDISMAWGDGVYLYENTRDTKIIGNHIHHCRRQGISVVWANDTVISDNIIHTISGTNPQSCIDIEPNSAQEVHKVIISNNILKDAKACVDVYAGSGGAVVEGVIINDNLMSVSSSASYCIYVNGDGIEMSGNRLTGSAFYELARILGNNNKFSNNLLVNGSGYVALRIEDAEKCDVSNNTLSNLTLSGTCIYVNNSNYNLISNNSVIDCETTGSDEYGLYLVRSDYNKVDRNIMSNITFNYGIAIGTDADYNQGVGNIIDGTYTWTVRDRVGSGAGNNFYLNTLKSGSSGTFSTPFGGDHHFNVIDGTWEP